jgi:branched-chain amino acid transport system ATP-binding protein
VLDVAGLSKRFGGLAALTDYDLKLRRGEVLGLIGPNGAGKTTAFNLLTGVLRRAAAASRSTAPISPAPRPRPSPGPASPGPSRTSGCSATSRVWENVAVGCHMREAPGWLATVLGASRRAGREAGSATARSRCSTRVGLGDVADQRAGDLPYGLQRKVEIARALATDPPAAARRAGRRHEHGRDRGVTETCASSQRPCGPPTGRAHHGRGRARHAPRDGAVHPHPGAQPRLLLAEGTPAEIQRHEAVIEAYLGTAGGGRPCSRLRGSRSGAAPRRCCAT